MDLNTMKRAWNMIRKELLIYLLTATALVTWGIIWYYHKQLNKDTQNDYKVEKEWAKYPPQISSITAGDARFEFNQDAGTGHLRDYYIASSYNSCCGGDFQDDYVSLVPLRQVIFQGCRVLDFEIYSVDGDVVVAASPSKAFNIKGTYNSLEVGGTDGVLAAINKYAFNHASCPNPSDPLFIHFRIKSNRQAIYPLLTKYVKDALAPRLLGAAFGYEGRPNNPAGSKNLAIEPLLNLMNKVVIICDQTDNSFRDTPFEELVNLSTGSPYFTESRNYDIQYTHDPDGMIQYNKKNITMTMPDLSALDTNVPAQLHMSYGCQMVSMNYQNLDSNMKYYFDIFNGAGTAFVLKPAPLRYIPVVIDLPAPQDPRLTYAPKPVSLPMYQTQV